MNLEQTQYWDDPGWTETRTAVIPARMQPMHAGHVNLIQNVRARFASGVIMLVDRLIEPRNPFTVQERYGWIQSAVKDLPGCPIQVTSTTGLSGMDARARRNFLQSLSPSRPIVFISRNPDVSVSAIHLGLHYMVPKTLDPRYRLNPMLEDLNGNAGKIRQMLLSEEPIPEDTLAPNMDEMHLRRLICSRLIKHLIPSAEGGV